MFSTHDQVSQTHVIGLVGWQKHVIHSSFLISNNSWVLFDTPVSCLCRSSLPRVVAAWLRCYVMVNVVYFLTGGMWAYYVYLCWGDRFFSTGNMPAAKDMWEQIKVHQHSRNSEQHLQHTQKLPVSTQTLWRTTTNCVVVAVLANVTTVSCCDTIANLGGLCWVVLPEKYLAATQSTTFEDKCFIAWQQAHSQNAKTAVSCPCCVEAMRQAIQKQTKCIVA